MKPHEEDWTADDDGYLRDAAGDCIFIGDAMGDGAAIPPGRAKLAAKAPKMARLLLAFRDWKTARVPPPWDEIESVLREADVLP